MVILVGFCSGYFDGSILQVLQARQNGMEERETTRSANMAKHQQGVRRACSAIVVLLLRSSPSFGKYYGS
jgi:hypothetical protein